VPYLWCDRGASSPRSRRSSGTLSIWTQQVLKLRAIRANGDFDDYWRFHLEHERRRVHESRYYGAQSRSLRSHSWSAAPKANCRCKADPPSLHGPYIVWTRKVDQKTVTRVLSPDQLEDYRPLLDNARRLRELVTELQSLTLDVVEGDDRWRTR